MSNYPVLFISDGAGHDLNLLDRGGAHVNGWIPKYAELRGGGAYNAAALADGRSLSSAFYENVVEEIPLYIRGADADQIADWQHRWADLQGTLRNYFINASRNYTRVYIGWREQGQTSIQYAVLKNANVQAQREAFAHQMRGTMEGAVWVATLFLEREPFWQSHPPGTLPTNALSLTQTQAPSALVENYLTNTWEETGTILIYRFDSSAGTWSGDLAASTSFEYFPNPVGSGDMLYIGMSSTVRPYRSIVFHIGTPRVAGDTSTIVYEYWNGAAWAIMGGATIPASDTTDGFRESGQRYVKILSPNDWVNSSEGPVPTNAFWTRYRITILSGMTTIPAQSTRRVYIPMEPKLTLAAAALQGDVPSLLRFNFNNKGPANSDITAIGLFQVIVGAKSRGLTNFRSHLDAGNMPTGWTVSVGTDTSGVTDPLSPTNQRKSVTFATDQTLIARLTWQNTNDDVASDFTGVYRAFLRCNQITGSIGDVSVQLQVAMNNLPLNTEGVTYRSTTKRLRRVSTQPDEKQEVVDFGIVNIPLLTNARGLSSATGQTLLSSQINISIYASATSATPDLYLYDLILIPVDEFFLMAEAPDIDGSIFQAIHANNALLIDGGLLQPGAQINNNWRSANDQILPGMQWYMNTPLPMLSPDRQTALFFFFTDGGNPILSTPGQGCMVEIWPHERWLHFRGDE